MSNAFASTYQDMPFDIFDLGNTLTKPQKRQKKIEIDILNFEGCEIISGTPTIYIQSDFGATAASGYFEFAHSYPEAISVTLDSDIPLQARAIIAEKAQSSNALVEGYLSNLMASSGPDRFQFFNLLVDMDEPNLVLNSAFDLFGRGHGAKALEFATSLLERSSSSLEAYRSIFVSQPRGVELLLSSFLNSKFESIDKVEALIPLTESKSSLIGKVLIEELQGAAPSVAKPILERLVLSKDENVSALAKDALEEVA